MPDSQNTFRQIKRAGLLFVVGCAAAFLHICATTGRASEPTAIEIRDALPYGKPPINYHDATEEDAVSQLQGKLESGQVQLEFVERFGYLPALLKALDVSVTSQVLVFSKTALNPKLVGPRNPRAVYFNEQVYVGYVPGAAALEVASIDPVKGGLFWALEQNADKPPRLVRESRCLACHVGSTTLQVPGFMVRSFLTDEMGTPAVGYSRVTHATPIANRWGGWYVTGATGGPNHRGNLIGEPDRLRHKREPDFRGTLADLKEYVDLSSYISPHSDVVAHLVLNHQAHGQNLLFRVGYEARLNRRSDAEEQLSRYLLMLDEAPLPKRVEGSSGFAEWFQRQGPKSVRKFRKLDLKTRLLEHRVSYLVDSPTFDRLPGEVKTRVYERMLCLLQGDAPPDADPIPEEERETIIKLLRTKVSDLPEAR